MVFGDAPRAHRIDHLAPLKAPRPLIDPAVQR
jgi:hypothetical protein